MGLFYNLETYNGLKGSSTRSYSYPRQWSVFTEDVKKLYIENNFKRCLNQCENMLQEHSPKLHCLHETFLHFYVAICNESLGMAAYKYSAKKLSFLDNAKDAFTAAMLSLPSQPMLETPVSSASGTRQTLLDIQHLLNPTRASTRVQALTLEDPFNSRPAANNKPLPPTPSDSGYDTQSEPSPTTPTFVPSSTSNTDDLIDILPHISSSHLRTFARETQIYTTLRSSSYNKHSPSNSIGKSSCQTHPQPLKPDLVPRPLSIQKRASSASNNLLNLCASPATRAPLAPRPNSSHLLLSHPLQLSKKPKQPNPALSSTSSIPPEIYASHAHNLTSFHTQLIKQLSTLNTLITDTVNAQIAHRANQSKRMASFWSFTPYTDNTDTDRGRDRDQASGLDVKPGILTTGGSLENGAKRSQGLGMDKNKSTNSLAADGGTKAGIGTGMGRPERRWKKEETPQERAARIKRLKERGWRVSKDLYGWRGQAYYEALREGAVGDLFTG